VELEGGNGDADWSFVEITCHLRNAEQRSLARVRRMCDEDGPMLEAEVEAAKADGRWAVAYASQRNATSARSRRRPGGEPAGGAGIGALRKT
jgi:hypothetical protein